MESSWRLEAFDRLLSATPASVAVLRLVGEVAVIDLIDPGTAAAFGSGAGELAGRRLDEVYPVADAAEITSNLRLARRRGRIHYEATRDLPAGRRTVEVQILPIGDDRYLLFARDVSSERENARRMEQLERVAGIGMFHWNVTDDRLAWSDQVYRIFGYEPGELEMTLDRFLGHVHRDDRAEQDRLIERARNEGETVTTSFRIVRTDGQERMIEVHTEAAAQDGKLLYALGTMQDITERLELEQAAEHLRRAHARRQTGLEVHDKIVQGLATVWLALELEDYPRALEAVESTTANAQAVVQTLLANLAAVQELEPGDLVTRQVEPASPEAN